MDWLGISSTSVAAIVIALSFAVGLNLYATVGALGLMARLHWVVLPPGLGSLANSWIIAVATLLFALEFVADKIPGFDLIWNALHTFIRIPAAALLAYAAGEHLTPELHLLVTCLGAVVAAIAHTGKTALRVAVTPSPEPVSNIALSTSEDAAAAGLSWIALHHPLAAGISVLCLTLAATLLLWRLWRFVRAAVARLKTRLTSATGIGSITSIVGPKRLN